MLINVRSLTFDKIDSLINDFIELKNVQICYVTKTWLKATDHAIIAEINLGVYQILSSPRTNKRGVGIALICPINYICRQIKINKYAFFKTQEVTLVCTNKLLRFSTFYRTGPLSVEERVHFLGELNDYMETLVLKTGDNIVWGDFNICKNQPQNKLLYKDFLDLMESKGFKCLINEPTHILDLYLLDTGGVLDLVFISVDFCIQNLEIFDHRSGFEISDHYPIKFDLRLTAQNSNEYIETIYRDYSKINLDNFEFNLNIDLMTDASKEKEIDRATLGLLEALQNIVDTQ